MKNVFFLELKDISTERWFLTLGFKNSCIFIKQDPLIFQKNSNIGPILAIS